MRDWLAESQHQVAGHCGVMPILALDIQHRLQRLDEVRDRLDVSMKASLATMRQVVRTSCHALDLSKSSDVG